MNRPTITAHSGCDGTKDGSIDAIRRGIELGADLVEVDVRRVPGLGLALSHDAADGPGDLVPLERAFAEVAKHPAVGINCDLKAYGLAEPVLALAASCGMPPDRLAFSGSLAPSHLAADPTLSDRARIYLNIEEALSELIPGGRPAGGAAPWDVVRGAAADGLARWIDPLIALCLGLGVRALNLPADPLVRPHLARLGGAGVRCSVWTVNEPGAMRELLSLPYLDNLTTRRVALAVSVRASLPA